VTVYSWNDEGRLVGAIVLDGNGNPLTQMGYRYNANGIRVMSSTDGQQTFYLVDEVQSYAQVVEEYDAAGTTQVSYVYGHDLINQTRGTQTTFYLVDGLGSTRLLTDAQGNVVNVYDYEAFGETINQSGTAQNGYLFTGEQFDTGLGDYYLRDRFYDAGVGRFTRRDKHEGRLGEPLTLHDYLYAHGDPINLLDPTGKFSVGEKVAASVIAGILAQLAFPAPVLTTTDPDQKGAYNPIIERFLVELLAGGLLLGLAAAAKNAATSTITRIPSSEEMLEIIANQQSLGVPPDKLAGFVIHGTKGVSGNTFQRNILEITKDDSRIKSFSEFIKLMSKFEEEAAKVGATQVRILAYEVVNPKLGPLLANPKFAERYGLIIRQINPEVVEILKKL
jgi:RHS repeat-associated protein